MWLPKGNVLRPKFHNLILRKLSESNSFVDRYYVANTI